MRKELRQYRATPPKGFQLDSDETQSEVKLPAGFTLDTDKKKVPTVGGSVSQPSQNVATNTSSSSVGEKSQNIFDPAKSLLDPLRNQYQQAQSEFNPLRNRAVPDQTRNVVLPVGVKNQMFDESDFNTKKTNEKVANVHLTQTEEELKRQLGNVKVARQVKEVVKQNNGGVIPKDNETNKIIDQTFKDYSNLSNDIIKGKSLVGAAIGEELKNNPQFSKYYKTLGGKIPRSYEGKLVYGYLQRHGDNVQAFVEEHPEYKKEFDDLVKNFAAKYPETAATQIGNEVSQAYEKDSHAFADLDTQSFNKKVDEKAAELYKDNPEKLALYNTLVKDNKDKYFKSAAALNAFGGEVLTGLNSTMNSLRSITGLRDSKERAYDVLDKDAQFINPNAKGIREWVNTGSGFLGMMTQVASAGGVLKGLGAAEIGAHTVPTITRFYDDQLKDAQGRFGDNWKAKLSADVSTALFAYGFPANRLRGAIDNAIKDAGEKASVSSVRARITDALGTAAKQYVKGTSEMTGITAIQQVVDAALGSPHANAADELVQTAKSMAMGNVAPALIGGAGKYIGTKVEKPSELNEVIGELPDGIYTSPLKEAIKSGDEAKVQTYLKDIAEQLSNPQSSEVTRKMYGDKLSDIATKLYPNAKSEPINIEQPINQGSGENITEREQGVGGELGKGVEVGTNNSGESVGDKTVEDNSTLETDDAVMKGVKSNYIVSTDMNGDNIETDLPESGFIINEVFLKDGREKGKGSGQEIYKKALEKHSVLYSLDPSADAKRVQDKLAEKGFAKIEDIALENGVVLRKITKPPNKLIVASKDAFPISELNKMPKGVLHNSEDSKRKLMESIQKDGIKEPLTLRYYVKDNALRLIEGHHRLDAANKLGIEKLPVDIQVDWDESMKDMADIKGQPLYHPPKPLDVSGYERRNYKPSNIKLEELGFKEQQTNEVSIPTEKESTPITEPNTNIQELENKKNDIERRRKDELSKVKDLTIDDLIGKTVKFEGNPITVTSIEKIGNTGVLRLHNKEGVYATVREELANDSYLLYQIGKGEDLNTRRKEINDKYDNELSQLIKQYEIPKSTESSSITTKEADTNIQPTAEGENTANPIGETIEGQPPSETPPVKSGGVYAERPATELSHRGLQDVANEFTLDDVKSRDRKSDIQLRQDAENTMNDWKEKGVYAGKVEELTNKAETKGILNDEERVIMEQHLANIIGEARKLDKNSTDYDAKLQEIKRLKDAGEITRSAAGAALRIPSNSGSHARTLEDAMVERMEAAGVDTLTPEQKKDVEEKFSLYEEKQKEAESKIADLERKNTELQAELELAKQKKATKPSKKDFKAERQNIRNSIKDKWSKAANDNTLTAVPLPYAKQLAAISPDVAKLMKSYIEEGITTFSEIVDKIHDDIKDVVAKRDDVIDILAGKHNEPKESKIDLLTKLKQIKNKKSAEAVKIIAKLRTGDFEKTKKPKSIFDNPELQKKYPKEYKQTLDAIVASEKAKHELALANLNEEMKNRTVGQKALGHVGRFFRTLKALKAGIDDSGIGVQTLLAGLANPVAFGNALKEHTLDALSASRFERNLARLHNSDYWPLIEKSGLSVVDPKSLRESEKNDIFNDTYFDYMKVKINGKERSFAFTKPFERAFTSLGNNLRVNMFLRRAEQMMADKKNPISPETHPEEFEALAKVINNLSGRGTMNKKLEAHNQLLSTVLWSPKLLASSANILGLGEFSGKGFYRSLTPRQQKYVASQLVRGIGMGVGLMALLSYSSNGDSDLDPLSPTFGTVKVGDYRYTIFGRYTSVVRTVAMAIMREKHTSKGIDDLTDRRGASLQDELIKFIRGKANPTLGIGWDVVTGKTYEGKPFDPINELQQSAIPMSIDDIRKGLSQDGTLGILKRGIPSFLGVKVSHEKDFPQTGASTGGGAGAKGSYKPRKRTKPHKN